MTHILRKWMPDFLGIGAARAGTTWIWWVLRQHPDVWMPRTKELHFFDRQIPDFIFESSLKEMWYQLRYMLYFLPGKIQGKMTGEFTPAYCLLPAEKIYLIHNWMPNVKLLFIMRDPVLRAWSHAKKDFQRKTGKPLREASYEDLIAFFELRGVKERGNYAGCLKKWMKFFPNRQILILFLEDVVKNPQHVVHMLFKFLRNSIINYDERVLRRPIHQSSLQIDIPPRVREYLQEQLYTQNSELRVLVGRSLPWE